MKQKKLTDFDKWLKTIEIQIDTREKEIDHITAVFDYLNVKYKLTTLKAGDYTFNYNTIIDNGLGSSYEVPQESNIIIERKNSIDEITQNFTKHRDRFKREFEKLTAADKYSVDKHLIIENNVLNDVFTENYRSDMHPNSLIMSILSFNYRYGVQFHFISKFYTANLILRLFYANYQYLILEK